MAATPPIMYSARSVPPSTRRARLQLRLVSKPSNAGSLPGAWPGSSAPLGSLVFSSRIVLSLTGPRAAALFLGPGPSRSAAAPDGWAAIVSSWSVPSRSTAPMLAKLRPL